MCFKCASKTGLSIMKRKAVLRRVHVYGYTCASVPPKEPYRSSPGIVTGAVLSHISPRCLFVQQHLRASPPLTAARYLLRPMLILHRQSTESKRSNKTADFFYFYLKLRFCWEEGALQFVGGLNLFAFMHTHT